VEAPRKPPPRAGTPLLLDACVAINLYATRRMEEIIRVLEEPVGVVDLVRSEALHVRRGGTGDDADEREALDLGPLVDAGLLVMVTATEAELDAFVAWTRRLDDGEALTAAVAISRGWTVATDDRKAIRLLSGHVPLRSTLDLVKVWADRVGVGDPVVAQALHDLRERGPYLPRRDHPLKAWWDAYLSLV